MPGLLSIDTKPKVPDRGDWEEPVCKLTRLVRGYPYKTK